MKRPSGLWILLSAGVLWLSVQNVYCARPTSLKFKSTTTTTTTTTALPETSEEEGVTTEVSSEGNVTKPTLTGNPQLDYIYDPNLPKELNGYNLSDYPFYERVPEDIDFKCDGLHDGFYASVKHKCQVYHHCLYGTRYDFLCANYTAFDQKTFICHFASEVDCNNSKKFWHRNDALYQAASTTTIRTIPTTVAYTPPPVILQTSKPIGGPRRVVGRPYRRRRPQFEYYDEYYDDFYYDDRPRSRGRKRPRPRPRPVYDDDYDEEYDEERYEKRGSGARRKEQRRPYSRRPSARGRNKERVKIDYDEEDQFDEEGQVEDDRGSRRKPAVSGESRSKNYQRRRPSEDELEEDEGIIDRPSSAKKEQRNKQTTDSRTIIKPVSGTVYDRPRLAPRIKLPVPKNEAKKYAYKPESSSEIASEDVLEYDDDYEEVEAVFNSKRNKPSNGDKVEISKNSRKQESSAPRFVSRKPTEKTENRYDSRQSEKKKPVIDDYENYEYEDDQPVIYAKNERKVKPTSTKPPSTTTATTTTTTTSTTTTTTMAPIEKLEQPLIRLVKRPFLPSRGGNPYLPRGLQPVGARVLTKSRGTSSDFEEQIENINRQRIYDDFAPSTVKTEVPEPPVKTMFLPSDAVVDFPVNSDSRQKYMTQGVSVHQPKFSPRNPLDIDIDEYDVTLNDALNPTLPNLPVRGYPSGFDVRNDYTFSNFQRGSYPSDQAVATANTGYNFKSKPPDQRQRYELHSQVAPSEEVYSNANYKGQLDPMRDSYRPRQAQNTQAFYPGY
ncbi:cuticular protein analogous to peritrophins 1-H isoform X1 [Leptinotarsa decemlineata]|uniref:cuticular protein analogous to peritrophins 1-H isoform X1 n=1 Tax=Leptinotarsa decemlineata TaxID=7539 RepID=UPI003D309C39